MFIRQGSSTLLANYPIQTSHHSSSIPNPLIYTHGLAGTNQVGNYAFVNAIVIFFFSLCAVFLVFLLAKKFNNHLRHMYAAAARDDRQLFWTYNHQLWWPWIKQHLLYAPIGKTRHNREIQLSSAVSIGTLPSRFQTLILVAYAATNIAYCAVLDYSQNQDALLAELRGRTGSLAAINLIPTVLFALRNNPLISLLGISYDAFNLTHRWAARIVVLEALVHTLSWGSAAVNAAGFSGISQILHAEVSFQWGMVATVFFVVIALQAWSPIRHAFYETFLTSHRIFVLIALLGVWAHLDLGKLPQLPYVQLALMLWILEWVCRSGKIIRCSYSRRQIAPVTVQALPAEACRITFELARPWNYKPGCHAYAYFPSIAGWSGHPFSIAWSEDRERIEEKEEKDLDQPRAQNSSVSLIVRSRTGMTRKLYEKAAASPNGTITIGGAIEGPYGGQESLDSYGTVLLFAGGVGITQQIGYIRHLLRGFENGTVATRKVILVWSVPTTEALEWIRPWMDEILRMDCRREVLKVMLYVTKPVSQQQISSTSVQVFPGRCNPKEIVDEVFAERVGALHVSVCGPGAFSDTVRQAVRSRVSDGLVDFYEEQFTF